ncbi:hypothetical protein [Clavibacter michiganensis]|uniref:hypothetical protein n=1 Tax=Clavibacter michiganensis TaxID=28447 RepID=UPI003159902A
MPRPPCSPPRGRCRGRRRVPDARGRAERGSVRLPVEAPVRDRAGHEHLRGRTGGPRRDGREPGEALLEVDADREAVDVAGEGSLPVRELVARAEAAAEDERREGLDVDRVPLEVDVVQPDHRGAAVVAVLVVHEVHGDVVARAVRHRGAAGLPVVPVEGEEDLVVLADEGVPEALAVVVEHGGSVGLRVDDVVRREDHRQRRVRREHAARPLDAAGAGAPVEREDEPVAAARREGVERVVAVRAGSAVARRLPEALRPERVEVGRAAALVVGGSVDVVVAGQHAPRRAGLVEERELRAGSLDLVGGAVLGHVAEVREEDDVVPVALGEHVAQRRLQRLGVDRLPVEEVLRVRQHGDREAGRCGVGLPTGAGSLLRGGRLHGAGV